MKYIHLITLFVLVVSLSSRGNAADEFERPPIDYSRGTPDNAISRLQGMLDSGELTLNYEPRFGYLPALLQALQIPRESQMLVFSKTSLQLRRITPRTPRAIYFNDDVYLGYCHAGDVLEISVADSNLGTVFYTLDQEARDSIQFVRHTDNCLICHSSSRTEGVPGHLVRSLFVESTGQPIFAAGSYTVDHTTPFAQRWGGWYVTGTHGTQTHLGNLVVEGRQVPQPVNNEAGQNVTDLSTRILTTNYLTPHSDLVALMLLEHQAFVHNRITKANFAARQALHYQRTLNAALGEAEENRLDSTTRRINSAAEDLLDALLMVDEAELAAPLRGTSGFAETFEKIGPRDDRQRSLRDLDLSRRMFKYPCSYLIYSSSFDGLPEVIHEHLWLRLWEILTGRDTSPKYAHLSTQDRTAILEILVQTKPGLPDYWQQVAEPLSR